MRTSKDSTINPDYISRLKSAGFAVTDEGGNRVLVSKYSCAALLEKAAGGELRFAVSPGLLACDGIAHLLDRGFQKFWQSGDRTVPAVAEQLKSLHQFEQDLRAALGLTGLYNQSLGTVSSRYVYDRVEGREQPKVHQSFD